MTENIVFDNILIVDSLRTANEFAKETWVKKRDAERLADPKAVSFRHRCLLEEDEPYLCLSNLLHLIPCK